MDWRVETFFPFRQLLVNRPDFKIDSGQGSMGSVLRKLFYRHLGRHLDRGRKAGCWWDGGLGGLGVGRGGRGCSVGICRR